MHVALSESLQHEHKHSIFDRNYNVPEESDSTSAKHRVWEMAYLISDIIFKDRN